MAHPEDIRNPHKSKIVAVLREGIGIVQMVFFKELRVHLKNQYPEIEQTDQSMLAGAITNELFGTPNMEERFTQFRGKNEAIIEKELSALSINLPHLKPYLTDALRVQTLCDSHEGSDNTDVLEVAERLDILIKDRDIPLPSTFMSYVRGLGEQHQLIIAPVQINPEDDSAMIH